jgi:CHAP domain
MSDTTQAGLFVAGSMPGLARRSRKRTEGRGVAGVLAAAILAFGLVGLVPQAVFAYATEGQAPPATIGSITLGQSHWCYRLDNGTLAGPYDAGTVWTVYGSGFYNGVESWIVIPPNIGVRCAEGEGNTTHFTITATTLRQKITNLALAQFVTPPYTYKHYGFSNDWCSSWAKWVWENSGAGVLYTTQLGPAVKSFYDYGTNNLTSSSVPVEGDAVIFGSGTGQHVGIVTGLGTAKVNGTTVQTIQTVEGNDGTLTSNDWRTNTVQRAEYYAAPGSGHYVGGGLPYGTYTVLEYVSPVFP